MVDLGQNFLVDRDVLLDIITAAELTPDDVVLEIGPGKGVLTEELAKRAKHIIAVELDRGLVAELQKKFHGVKNVTIVHEDILRWWPRQSVKVSGCQSVKVVANIPYRITAPILRLFLDPPAGGMYRPALMVLMVQKEVAERVCAKPGNMSILSLAVQYCAKPEIVHIVPRTAFDPAPRVDSAILKIIPYQKQDYPKIRDRVKINSMFFRLVKMGFASRRKQLQNLLASGLHITNDDAKKALHAVGFSPRARAQELSVEAWIALTKRFFSA